MQGHPLCPGTGISPGQTLSMSMAGYSGQDAVACGLLGGDCQGGEQYAGGGTVSFNAAGTGF